MTKDKSYYNYRVIYDPESGFYYVGQVTYDSKNGSPTDWEEFNLRDNLEDNSVMELQEIHKKMGAAFTEPVLYIDWDDEKDPGGEQAWLTDKKPQYLIDREVEEAEQ